MLCLLTAASICLRCARGARREPVRPTGGRAPPEGAQRRAKVGATCARGTTKQKPPAPRRSRGAGGARPRRGRAGREPRREGQTRSTANRDRGHGAGARSKEHLGPRAGIRFQRMIKARRGHLRRCAHRSRANPQFCRAAGNSPGSARRTATREARRRIARMLGGQFGAPGTNRRPRKRRIFECQMIRSDRDTRAITRRGMGANQRIDAGRRKH